MNHVLFYYKRGCHGLLRQAHPSFSVFYVAWPPPAGNASNKNPQPRATVLHQKNITPTTHPLLTSILRGLACSAFGRTIFNTPS